MPNKFEGESFNSKTEKGQESNEQPSEYTTSLLTQEDWPEVKDQVTKLVLNCFPNHFPDDSFKPLIEDMFTKTFRNDVIVLLKDDSAHKLIGLTQAHIYTEEPTLANIGMTGVASDQRGQGLVGIMVARLEEELRNKGVEYITRQANIANGYADAIERHYGDRIIEKRDLESNTNPQRYFKIKL